MNAHKRHGYSCSDVVDFAQATYRRRRTGLRISAFHLNGAAELRRRIGEGQAKRFKAGDYRSVEDFKRLARRDAMRAREWRLELQGA